MKPRFSIEYDGLSFRIRCPGANEGKGAVGEWCPYDKIATLATNGSLYIAGSPFGLIEEHIVYEVVAHDTKVIGDIPLDLDDEEVDDEQETTSNVESFSIED